MAKRKTARKKKTAKKKKARTRKIPAKRKLERKLEEGLEETFPASDALAVTDPVIGEKE